MPINMCITISVKFPSNFHVIFSSKSCTFIFWIFSISYRYPSSKLSIIIFTLNLRNIIYFAANSFFCFVYLDMFRGELTFFGTDLSSRNTANSLYRCCSVSFRLSTDTIIASIRLDLCCEDCFRNLPKNVWTISNLFRPIFLPWIET